MPAETPCYIARTVTASKDHPANTAVSAVVDDGLHPEMVQRAVTEWLRDGLVIERTTVGWCREHLFTQEPV